MREFLLFLGSLLIGLMVGLVALFWANGGAVGSDPGFWRMSFYWVVVAATTVSMLTLAEKEK